MCVCLVAAPVENPRGVFSSKLLARRNSHVWPFCRLAAWTKVFHDRSLNSVRDSDKGLSTLLWQRHESQSNFNPIQARGAHCAPSPKSQHIFKTVWSLEFPLCDFSFYEFPFWKVQFNQSALMYVAMATIQLFGLILKTWISIVFQVFPPERNVLWDNFLCFGHHYTLIIAIKANIRTVTMETLQKIILPKCGHQH